MITADEITVGVGDKVWLVGNDKVTEGVVISIEEDWVEVEWTDKVSHWSSLNLFGSESNALNILMYRTLEKIKQLKELEARIERRLNDINN